MVGRCWPASGGEVFGGGHAVVDVARRLALPTERGRRFGCSTAVPGGLGVWLWYAYAALSLFVASGLSCHCTAAVAAEVIRVPLSGAVAIPAGHLSLCRFTDEAALWLVAGGELELGSWGHSFRALGAL